MKARGEGQVAVVLSTTCRHSFETMGAYTAAKMGLAGLVDVFRKEARPHNIRVTSIYPGGTDSNFRKNHRPDYMRPECVAEALVGALGAPLAKWGAYLAADLTASTMLTARAAPVPAMSNAVP